MYTREHTGSGETHDAHIARMGFYADRVLHVTKGQQGTVFQHLEHQARFHISRIVEYQRSCTREPVLGIGQVDEIRRRRANMGAHVAGDGRLPGGV